MPVLFSCTINWFISTVIMRVTETLTSAQIRIDTEVLFNDQSGCPIIESFQVLEVDEKGAAVRLDQVQRILQVLGLFVALLLLVRELGQEIPETLLTLFCQLIPDSDTLSDTQVRDIHGAEVAGETVRYERRDDGCLLKGRRVLQRQSE